MFTVEGFLDGVYYTAVVDGPDPEAGVVSGSPNIVMELQRREGEDYEVTPVGPFGALDVSDPASVMEALASWTQIRAVTGDAPSALRGHTQQPGVVYLSGR